MGRDVEAMGDQDFVASPAPNLEPQSARREAPVVDYSVMDLRRLLRVAEGFIQGMVGNPRFAHVVGMGVRYRYDAIADQLRRKGQHALADAIMAKSKEANRPSARATGEDSPVAA